MVPRGRPLVRRSIDEPVDDIERALTTLVRRANLPRLYDRLAASAGIPLDRASYVTLGRVDEDGPVRVRDLARALGVDPSTASRQVGLLERTGLVARVTDDGDGRAVLVKVTQVGIDALRRMREARRLALAEIMAPWPDADRVTFAALLTRLTDGLIDYDVTDRDVFEAPGLPRH